LGLILLIVYV